jgi:S-formylglutathione hydrolase FrmB
MTRRQVLLGGAALALSACTRSRPPGFASGGFRSAAMGGKVGWAMFRPAVRTADRTADRTLPLLLVLHGRGGNHLTAFDDLHLDTALSKAVRGGVPPFAIASVDGGADSYYHPRRSGIDPQRMILEELLPLLARHGARTSRFAVGGWSMGGYGALLLAERLGRSRVAAVAVDSPALYLTAGSTAAGAFDDAEDFHRHDVLVNTSLLLGIPVRVTCGESDSFLPGARRLLAEVPAAQHDIRPGGHDEGFWRASAPAQLAFVGRRLS